MEILKMPRAMANRGIKGWPKILVLGKNEPVPTDGIPFIRATRQDYALTFRLMVPILMKSNPEFDWAEVYEELTGRKYKPAYIYRQNANASSSDNVCTGTTAGEETTTLYELAADMASHVDLNMLLEMKMIPAFYEDVAEAIKVNITNSFEWTDGYNKKTGLCSGYLTEQSRKKSLVILDISSSIPEGLSAGMMTLIQTITEVTHADLILTGGTSYFYTNEEVRTMDIHAERKRIPRSNERDMFKKILEDHDMNYDVVIAFGDSDYPGEIKLEQKIQTRKFFSFFVAENDRYGRSYTTLSGYGRWVKENNPDVEIIHNYKWAKVFANGKR